MATIEAVRTRPIRSQLDRFTAEIIRSYLVSTVREMVQTTVRTAYSTCFSEGEDFTCALFDGRARMIAQASGVPLHSGALFDALVTIRNSYDSFAEGDVVVFNDPYNGGSHQADVVIARPMFFEGKLLGFAANRGHWTDVGGMSPGGWSGTVRDVIQEGLIIPPVKLYKAGHLDREIKEFILKNIRIPGQNWGDIQAQMASNIIAERRVQALVRKYGLGVTEEGMEEALRYSRRRFATMLEGLPDGVWEGADYQEDDGHGGGPYKVHVVLRKEGRRVMLDFTGTDTQVKGPVNCTFTETKAACYNVLLALVDPYLPLNSGFLGLVDVKAPKGCMVNPVYPAPVFVTTADPMNKVMEALMKAAAQWLPDRVIAGTYCTGNNCTGSGDQPGTQEEFVWYYFEPGGLGARATKDGLNVEWHLNGNCKNESMEVWETRYPVRFLKYEMIADSGGPGRNRGGLGVNHQLKVLVPTYFTACADRHKIPPWGLFGGKEGAPNKFSVIRDGAEHSMTTLFGTLSPSKFANLRLAAGDVLSAVQGGGGGYGDPLERDPRLVEWDVLNGYVSPKGAGVEYGVAVNSQTGNQDPVETARLRRKLKTRTRPSR